MQPIREFVLTKASLHHPKDMMVRVRTPHRAAKVFASKLFASAGLGSGSVVDLMFHEVSNKKSGGHHFHKIVEHKGVDSFMTSSGDVKTFPHYRVLDFGGAVYKKEQAMLKPSTPRRGRSASARSARKRSSSKTKASPAPHTPTVSVAKRGRSKSPRARKQ